MTPIVGEILIKFNSAVHIIIVKYSLTCRIRIFYPFVTIIPLKLYNEDIDSLLHKKFDVFLLHEQKMEIAGG